MASPKTNLRIIYAVFGFLILLGIVNYLDSPEGGQDSARAQSQSADVSAPPDSINGCPLLEASNFTLWTGQVTTAGVTARTGPGESYPAHDSELDSKDIRVLQECNGWVQAAVIPPNQVGRVKVEQGAAKAIEMLTFWLPTSQLRKVADGARPPGGRAVRRATGSWSTSTSRDEMTGARSAYAHSRRVSPTQRMGFPYHDTQAWLGFGCDGSREWTYVGFSNAPNLQNTDTRDGYDAFTTRVRWDDALTTMGFIQTWGESFIHFQNDPRAIANMAASRSVRLELRWYGEGRIYFDFSLDGSSAAIQEARAAC